MHFIPSVYLSLHLYGIFPPHYPILATSPRRAYYSSRFHVYIMYNTTYSLENITGISNTHQGRYSFSSTVRWLRGSMGYTVRLLA